MYRVDRITTVEMHTGGEPVRIITGGYPLVTGATLPAKRRYALEHLDHLRRMLLAEPRGHAKMYGALLVPPDLPDADLAVLFLDNGGYPAMCGHAVIALGRLAVDRGLVTPHEPETVVRIQCPCGLVTARVAVRDGRAGHVHFASVPAFTLARDAVVVTDRFGPVTLDIAYGGAFYGILAAAEVGLDLETSPLAEIMAAAMAIKVPAVQQLKLVHPVEPELAFLYGIIFTDKVNENTNKSTPNICVVADGQIDRSPTGSGVTARMALMHRRGQIAAGEPRSFRSIAGSEFTGTILALTRLGPHPAVVVEVGGASYYTGEAVFTREPDDPLGHGFRLRH